MSIYQSPIVLESYPAYDVITFKVSGNGNINLKAGDMLINNLTEYTISSAVSFALANGECPIHTYNQCMKADGDAYWIISMGACLTSHKQAKETRIKVDIGQKVNFEGRIFEITKEPNHNLGLKPVEITENNRCIAVNA
ncbi:hypothetical protein UFOVP1295_40 [uncultured Caudovirales phage]|uniref:Uncharacterized protein n=1 Tax=uncultured Caudovirales phage TaxID=2100421 RepID=A0A6J5RQ87_9CAUD|nr:hypothetical protein UFOVP1295_40 [uncultured Caudovirales phage]